MKANILLVAMMLVSSSAFAAAPSNSYCPHSNKNQKTSDNSNAYVKTVFSQPAAAPAQKPSGGGTATRESGKAG